MNWIKQQGKGEDMNKGYLSLAGIIAGFTLLGLGTDTGYDTIGTFGIGLFMASIALGLSHIVIENREED